MTNLYHETSPGFLVHNLDRSVRIPIPNRPHTQGNDKIYVEKYLDINSGLEGFAAEVNAALSEGFIDIELDYNSANAVRLETDIEFHARIAEQELKVLQYNNALVKAHIELEEMYQLKHKE